MDPWQLINDISCLDQNSFSAMAFASEGSVWFTGHFPGEPILPGIAIVGAAYSAIKEEARTRGEDVELTSLRRVRFTSPVRPGEHLDIHLNREVHDLEIIYNFKVNVRENVVCSGIIAVVKRKRDK